MYTKEEALSYIEENDIKFIRLAFCDMCGIHKNISIMPQELLLAFEEGVGFNSYLINGFEGQGDLRLLPDPSTLSLLPWRPQQGGVVRFYCDIITKDGRGVFFDGRRFLKDTLSECKRRGFNCHVGIHSEFYLFKNDDEGNPTDEPFDRGGYLDIAPLDRGENIRREICLSLEQMGVLPEASYHEVGPGQNEIDFKESDALSGADHFMTYKNVVSSIAQRNGATASFAPKPIAGGPGNGLHLRISLYEGLEHTIEDDPELLSYFMAGVLRRMKDITVFLNAAEDSYLRFGENEAPGYISWSGESSSRLLRLIKRGDALDHFILRSPDSMINPYLAFAMVIQAGLEGIDNREELPPPQEKPGRELSDEDKQNMERLPQSLDEAKKNAKESSFLKSDIRYDITCSYLKALSERQMC